MKGSADRGQLPLIADSSSLACVPKGCTRSFAACQLPNVRRRLLVANVSEHHMLVNTW
jgi:hypothetical protein